MSRTRSRRVWPLVPALASLLLGGCALIGPGGGTSGDTDTRIDTGPSTIHGYVVDAGSPDRPIADARVYVPAAGDQPVQAQAAAAVAYAESVTAEDGYFELSGVPSGSRVIVVEPPSGSGYSALRMHLDVPGSAEFWLRLTLIRADLADRVASVSVSPPDAEVGPRGTVQYSARVADESGEALDLAPIWLATNSVGTIDEAGAFSAGAEERNGTIIALVGGFSAAATVRVHQPGNALPGVTLRIAPPMGEAPLPVTADASVVVTSGAVRSVALDWGDGTPTYEGGTFPPDLSHTYLEPGSYTATARATSDGGAEGSASVAVLVRTGNAPPTCSLQVVPTPGEAPLEVAFSGVGSDRDGEVVEWRISFGDGTDPWVGAAAPVDVGHRYDMVGGFLAQLTVTDDDGATATVEQQVVVSAHTNEPPDAALAVAPTQGPAPLVIEASDGGSSDPDGTLERYEIDFDGDGIPDWSGSGPPSGIAHECVLPGDHRVVLTVEDDQGARASTSQAITVTAPPALAVSASGVGLGVAASRATVDIANAGAGDLNWTCTPSTMWISVSPMSGVNDGTLTISVDRSGLDSGTHIGSIAVNSNGGSVALTVSLSVADAHLEVTPTSLHLLARDSSATFGIANTGGGLLSFECRSSEDWLSVSPTTGTGAAMITLTPDFTGLSTGTHAATVSVVSDGGSMDVGVLVDVPGGYLLLDIR